MNIMIVAVNFEYFYIFKSSIFYSKKGSSSRATETWWSRMFLIKQVDMRYLKTYQQAVLNNTFALHHWSQYIKMRPLHKVRTISMTILILREEEASMFPPFVSFLLTLDFFLYCSNMPNSLKYCCYCNIRMLPVIFVNPRTAFLR